MTMIVHTPRLQSTVRQAPTRAATRPNSAATRPNSAAPPKATNWTKRKMPRTVDCEKPSSALP